MITTNNQNRLFDSSAREVSAVHSKYSCKKPSNNNKVADIFSTKASRGTLGHYSNDLTARSFQSSVPSDNYTTRETSNLFKRPKASEIIFKKRVGFISHVDNYLYSTSSIGEQQQRRNKRRCVQSILTDSALTDRLLHKACNTIRET